MLAVVAIRPRLPAGAIRRKLWCGTALAMCLSAAGPALAQGVLPVVAPGGDGGTTIVRDPVAGTMTIDIDGANRIVRYNSFDLGTASSSSETLTFLNSGAAGSFSVLNRVNSVNGSTIHGSISAPGITIWLVDPQGVTFGPTGSFSGGGLIVSTALLTAGNDTSFLAGTLNTLNGASTKPIIFQTGSGAISASGSIVVVGQDVSVNRTMTSTNGSVALIAATDVSFANINSPLSFTVTRGTTLATGVTVGGSGNISGQSIRLAGGVDGVATAALLQVDPGASITATAANGSIVLATDTVGTVGIVNGGLTPGFAASGTLLAGGANADVVVIGAGLVNLAGSISAGRDVTLTSTGAAAGSVTAGGGITAGRNYAVSARNVTLGTAATTVTQAAAGSIAVTASAGNIVGLGNLTLQSNSDGAGTETLDLSATGGLINLGTTSSLIGGTAASRSNVLLTSGSSITAGNISALALLRTGNPTDLTLPGNLTLGNVTVASSLNITSAGGTIQAGNLTSTTGAIDLDAQGGDVVAGALNAANAIDLAARDNIRLVSATATTGSISLDAQTGSVSGIALPSPVNDGRPLQNFGRANLTASAAGQTIIVNADAGTTQLGALSAGAGPVPLNANQIQVSAGTVDLVSANAVNGHVDLESAAGTIRAGTLSAGTSSAPSDVIVNAPTGLIRIEGAVSASRDYRVTGSAVTLGLDPATVTQAADGAVAIRANTGNITGLGTLTVQSNRDGAGAETLYLNAAGAGGMVDFSADSQLLGGIPGGLPARRSAVLITSVPSLKLGQVFATSLGTFSNPAELGSNGSITTGDVIVDQSLRIISASGSITTGNIESLSGAIYLETQTLAALPAGAITAGTVKAADSISIIANSDLRLISAEATTGSIALGSRLGGIGTSGPDEVELTANGDGQTIAVTVAGAARLGSVHVGSGTSQLGDQFSVSAGSIDLDEATAVNGNIRLVANGGYVHAGALTAGTTTIAADVVVEASGAATLDGNISASQDYLVTAGGVSLESAGGPVTQSAGRHVTIVATGNIAGSQDLTLQSNRGGTTGGELTLNAGGIVNFALPSTILGGLEAGPEAARSDIWIRSNASLNLGKVVGRSLRTLLDPSALTVTGAVQTGDITVNRALAIQTSAGTIATGAVTVEGSGELLGLSAGGVTSDLTTGSLRTNGGDILLTAGQDIGVTTASTALSGTPATGTIALLSGRDIHATALAAGEDLALSGGAISFVTGTAGDDIDIYASGVVTLDSLASTGTGADTRIMLFDGMIPGQPLAPPSSIATGQLGHNILIRAGGLASFVAIDGDTDLGLVIRSMTGGSYMLNAALGDIRIDDLDAVGDINITAGHGSVSGLQTSPGPGWVPTSGGATITAPGNVVLEGVGAAHFAIGSVTASTVSTGTNAPDTLRLGTIHAGSLNLVAGSNLQIDDAQITGTANLQTTGGSAGAFNLTNASLVDGYGRANLSGADILVNAGGAAQLGTLLSGQDVRVTAAALDVLDATATLGLLSLTADSGRLTLGTGIAGTTATLVKEDADIGLPKTPAENLLTAGSVSAGDDVSLRSETGVNLGAIDSTGGNVTITAASGDVSRLPASSGAVTAHAAGKTISVTAANGDVQLGPLQAGQGGTTIAGAQVSVTATAIDLQGATATNGALALTATDGALVLGTGTAGTSATLIKRGAAGELSATNLTAAQDIAIQSQTNARLGTIKSNAGSIGVLAQTDVAGRDPGTGANLDAFQDLGVSAGGNIRLADVRAGDDIGLVAIGDVYLASAITDGSASDTSTILFDRTKIGQSDGIIFAPAPARSPQAFAGSDILIRAASLSGPAMTGDTDAGLVIGMLGSGSLTLSSAQGDIRAGTLTATGGDIAVTASRGSVTGRRSGFQSATGGSVITASGQLTLDVSGSVTAGAVSAGGAITNAGGATPDSIRLRSANAGTLALTAATSLQIDGGTVTGATTLSTTAGTVGAFSANGTVTNYGAAGMSASSGGKSITVDAFGAAQLGVLDAGQGSGTAAGDQLVIRGSGIRLDGAHARNGDILIETKTGLALLGAIDTVDASRSVTIRNNGSGSTIVGGTIADGGTDIALDDAEMDQIASGNVVIDSKAQNLTIARLTIAAATGKNSLRLLTTGAIGLTDTIDGVFTGVLQIGGSSTADPAGLVDETKLATQLKANIGDSGTKAAILLPNGTVDLRARKIVFARPTLADRYLPANGSSPSDAAVALDVANAASELYTADGTGRQFLTAKRLKVSYSNFALFQNTAAASGGGVVLNEVAPPSVSTLALQLFSTGERGTNSFALFGHINGFIGRAAGILPNESLEIWDGAGNPRVTRISQGNSRVNGCVIGSPDKGCLVTDPPRPNFSIYDQRQTQLFGVGEDPLLFFNPLVGRGNEGLIVDIADAPVGIDTIECDPSKGPCSPEGPK